MFDPTTGYLALGATHAHVLSARPDAPVVADLPRGSRPERVRTVRSGVAARLHSIATRSARRKISAFAGPPCRALDRTPA